MEQTEDEMDEMGRRKALAVVRGSGRREPEKRDRPADDAPLLVLLGLTSKDGAGDLAFCSGEKCSPMGLLIDMSKAWDPDGDGDHLAARCTKCDQAHWTIPFVRYIQEYAFNCEDDTVVIWPERFLAQTVENLRAKATAKAVTR